MYHQIQQSSLIYMILLSCCSEGSSKHAAVEVTSHSDIIRLMTFEGVKKLKARCNSKIYKNVQKFFIGFDFQDLHMSGLTPSTCRNPNTFTV